MQFHSVIFLFAFLPLSLLLYYAAPGRAKNAVLLLESIVFYGWGAIKFLPLALFLAASGYCFGRLIARCKGQKPRRAILLLAVLLQIGTLLLFKYGSYLSQLLTRLVQGEALSVFEVLPLGISYYCFKLVSYEADVYMEKCAPEQNMVTFLTYVLMFPQIIVGPIMRYRDAASFLHGSGKRCQTERMEEGVKLFVFGLAKKVLLADAIGQLWSEVRTGIGVENASSGLVWLGVIAFSLQLYFDFAGYSEMSNGMSRLFGVECGPNFDRPYQARSITDFWRRWHISLSGWFRDYIYIPLGGIRGSAARRVFNTLAVWVATGIWHGSTLNFLLWGLYYFVLLNIERWLMRHVSKHLQHRKRYQAVQHLYTLFFVVVGWGIFAASGNPVSVGLLLNKLFFFQGGISAAYYLRCYGVVLSIAVLDCTGMFGWFWDKWERHMVLRSLCVGALFVVCVAFMVGGTNQTALYAAF